MSTNPPGTLVYSAKFICGLFNQPAATGAVEGPVSAGRYSTAINVHNPSPDKPAIIRKKAVLLYVGSEPILAEEFERPRPPGRIVELELGPDWGVEIDAPDIRNVLLRTPTGPGPQAPTFIKGFVVLETSPQSPLDVVAVYTVAPLEQQLNFPPALEVERVPGVVVM